LFLDRSSQATNDPANLFCLGKQLLELNLAEIPYVKGDIKL